MNFELIKSITKGAAEIWERDGLVYFSRFTKKQREQYEDKEDRRIRSACLSGVRFDFYTNSKTIKINYEILNDTCRNWCYFDMYVNDSLMKSVGTNNVISNSGEVEFNIEGQETFNQITIYLPHLHELAISDFKIDDGAEIQRVPDKAKSLLCLGDSLTQGMDALYPSSNYPVILSRMLDMNVINQGVGGYVYCADSLDENFDYKPDIITVAYGTNDWSFCKTRNDFEMKVDLFYKRIIDIYDKDIIYVITPIWRFDYKIDKAMGAYAEIREIIFDTCEKYGIEKVIDGFTVAPQDNKYFNGDENVHLNDLGFMHYAQNLSKKLKGKR